jgi:hypothetical protein
MAPVLDGDGATQRPISSTPDTEAPPKKNAQCILRSLYSRFGCKPSILLDKSHYLLTGAAAIGVCTVRQSQARKFSVSQEV